VRQIEMRNHIDSLRKGKAKCVCWEITHSFFNIGQMIYTHSF